MCHRSFLHGWEGKEILSLQNDNSAAELRWQVEVSNWQAEHWVNQPLHEDFNLLLKVKSESLHVVTKYPWSNHGTSLNVRPSLCRIAWAQRCIRLENNVIFLAKFLRSAKDEMEWATCPRGTIFGRFKGFLAKQFCFTEGSWSCCLCCIFLLFFFCHLGETHGPTSELSSAKWNNEGPWQGWGSLKESRSNGRVINLHSQETSSNTHFQQLNLTT